MWPHLVSSWAGVQGGKVRSRSGCSTAGSLGLLVNDPILRITRGSVIRIYIGDCVCVNIFVKEN